MKNFFIASLCMLLWACGGASQPATTTTEATRELKFENVALPITISDPETAQRWMAENYWNRFDMADTAFIGTEQLKNAFAVWSMILAQGERDFSVATLIKFCQKVEAQPLMHAEMVRLAEGYFGDPNSEIADDTLFLALLDYMIESPLYDSLSKIRPRTLKEATLKNQVGDRVGDVTWVAIGGAKGSLYAVKAPLTLMMFYTPGCETCKGLFADIDSEPAIQQSVAAGRLKLIAIYADEDTKEWEAYAANISPEWLNVMATVDFKTKKPFIVRATPSLYLLDAQKRVVVRDGVSPYQILDKL